MATSDTISIKLGKSKFAAELQRDSFYSTFEALLKDLNNIPFLHRLTFPYYSIGLLILSISGIIVTVVLEQYIYVTIPATLFVMVVVLFSQWVHDRRSLVFSVERVLEPYRRPLEVNYEITNKIKLKGFRFHSQTIEFARKPNPQLPQHLLQPLVAPQPLISTPIVELSDKIPIIAITDSKWKDLKVLSGGDAPTSNLYNPVYKELQDIDTYDSHL